VLKFGGGFTFGFFVACCLGASNAKNLKFLCQFAPPGGKLPECTTLPASVVFAWFGMLAFGVPLFYAFKQYRNDEIEEEDEDLESGETEDESAATTEKPYGTAAIEVTEFISGEEQVRQR
jgi:hypothetical protein